ncbi:hypothetical protein C8T65DRAFT_626759, partial [Cerioporus squamosus]
VPGNGLSAALPDGIPWNPPRSWERRLSDAMVIICTHLISACDSLAVSLRLDLLYSGRRAVCLYIALSTHAPAEFKNRVALLMLEVRKLYQEYASSFPAIGNKTVTMTSELEREAANDTSTSVTYPLATNTNFTVGLRELVDLVERVHAHDAGKDHSSDVYQRSIALATILDDGDFVDHLDTSGPWYAATFFVLDGLKSVVALALAVKGFSGVLCDMADVQCHYELSVSVPPPTSEEVQRWCMEFLRVPVHRQHEWAHVFADAPKVSEDGHADAAAADDTHGEAVLLQYTAKHNVTIHPYIATSNDTMCFACYKLLLAVNAQRSLRLWTSSCCDMAPLPRTLPALPLDIEEFLLADLVRDLRSLVDVHRKFLAVYKEYEKRAAGQESHEFLGT